MPYSVRAGREDDWPFIEAWLTKALERGRQGVTVRECIQQVSSFSAQLWVIDNDGIVGFAITFVDGECFHVWLAGGKTTRWLPQLINFLRPVATAAGCGYLSSSVRPGLVRTLKRLGAKPTHTRMEIPL